MYCGVECAVVDVYSTVEGNMEGTLVSHPICSNFVLAVAFFFFLLQSVSKKYLQVIGQLEQNLDALRNWKSYRSIVQKCQPPLIPFEGKQNLVVFLLLNF